jgi:hypothetical protein
MRSMLPRSVVLAVLACPLALALAPRPARAAEPSEERREERASAARTDNLGVRVGLGPMIVAPTGPGPLGVGADLEGRYGFPLGAVVIAPGGRLSAFGISGRFVGTAMPTARVTVPVGPLAPYVVGGVGAGVLSNPGDSGFAVLGGGGLMVHVGHVIGFGAELSYRQITSTQFHEVAIGPLLQIGE